MKIYSYRINIKKLFRGDERRDFNDERERENANFGLSVMPVQLSVTRHNQFKE